MAVASASFKTSILSILDKLRVLKGSIPPTAPMSYTLLPPSTGAELIGTPSIIYSGKFPSGRRLFRPLIRIIGAFPGTPLCCCTSTPAIRPCNTSRGLTMGCNSISSAVTREMFPVRSRSVIL